MKRALAALVLTVKVAWPLVVVVVKVIVELGINEQVGVSLKFVGVTAHVKFTVPVYPLATDTVMICVPD